MILKISIEAKQELTGDTEFGYMYFDGVSEVFPKTVEKDGKPYEVTLTFYDREKNYHAILLRQHAYLMTDAGKTIDTICGMAENDPQPV